MGDKWSLSQMDNVTLFKPKVAKVILGQTTGKFTKISLQNK